MALYEILCTLRLYQDWQVEFLKRIEPAFPAGNSAFVALHEYSHPIDIGGLGRTRARLTPALSGFFRTARADDEMRNFLMGALEYLGSVAEGNIEVPVAIIRAMNDVERLAQIEESALPPEKQAVLRHALLQIARLAGKTVDGLI